MVNFLNDYYVVPKCWFFEFLNIFFQRQLKKSYLYFQAQSPIQQLELITDLLGTPSVNEMKFACEAAKRHVISRGLKPPSIACLYTLSPSATHEAVHFLCQMLTLDPEKRVNVVEALNHPYLDEGRLR